MIPYTAEARPDTGVSNVTLGFWLFIASEVMLFGALFSSYALLRVSAAARGLLTIVAALALVFLTIKGFEYAGKWQLGQVPATSTFFAMYYTLTGIHALHVLGGIVANLWVMAGAASVGDALTSARLRVVSHYWVFVDLVWLMIFAGMYLA